MVSGVEARGIGMAPDTKSIERHVKRYYGTYDLEKRERLVKSLGWADHIEDYRRYEAALDSEG